MLLRRYHKPQPEIEAVAEDAEVAAPLEATDATEEATEVEKAEAVAEDAEVVAPPKKSAGKKN
nr:MAG TPA: hypothetical protein [Caudoviricetes sp.]